MAVTEIATLRLTSPHTWDSPDITAFFGTLSTQQATWSSYPLRFLEDVTDHRIIYLITGWDSLPAHYEWIASEHNQKLLERAGGLVEVYGLEHAEVDSEEADARFVVWQQWDMRQGENIKSEGAGKVVDQRENMVCLLRGHRDEESIDGKGSAGKRTVRMKRLMPGQ